MVSNCDNVRNLSKRRRSALGGDACKLPGMEMDMRGMRVEETLAMLDDYIDSAYLAELPWVRIIHGKGTGALRQVIGDSCATIPWCPGLGVGSRAKVGMG